MYFCRNCETAFCENEAEQSRSYDEVRGNTLASGYDYEDECPFCHSTDLVEAKQCEECGEWYDEDDVYDGICDKCLNDKADLFTTLDFAEEQGTADELINSLLDDAEQKEILISALEEAMSVPKAAEHVKKRLKAYIKTYLSEFSEYVKEKAI